MYKFLYALLCILLPCSTVSYSQNAKQEFTYLHLDDFSTSLGSLTRTNCPIDLPNLCVTAKKKYYTETHGLFEKDRIPNQSSDSNKTKTADENKGTVLFLGLGASTYKFVDLYLFSVETYFGIGQKIYLGVGLDVYGKIKEEAYVRRPYASLTLTGAYNLCLNKIDLFFGPGLAYYYYYMAPILFLKFNYQTSEKIAVGAEIKSIVIRNRYIAKDSYFVLCPTVKFNLSFQL